VKQVIITKSDIDNLGFVIDQSTELSGHIQDDDDRRDYDDALDELAGLYRRLGGTLTDVK